MMEFTSFGDFAKHLAKIALAEIEAEKVALEHSGQVIEKRAKEKFGEYQPAVGEFAAWAPLAESTKADRERQGYPADEPLLRSGALRDTIEHQVKDNEAHIGSDDDVLLYQELGTSKMPPRSTLGAAAAESAEEVVKIIGETVVLALIGGRVNKAIAKP